MNLNLNLREPEIYHRTFSLDFHHDIVKKYPIAEALTILSLYKPITPYLTFGLNCVRSIPTLKKTIDSIIKGETIQLSQLMQMAYRVSLIMITIINPVGGMLICYIEDVLSELIALHTRYTKGVKREDYLVFGLLNLSLLAGICSQLLSFFKSDPRLLTVTLGTEVVMRTYFIADTIFKRGIRHANLFDSMMVMIRIYQYQLAVNPTLEPALDQPDPSFFRMRVGGVKPFAQQPIA